MNKKSTLPLDEIKQYFTVKDMVDYIEESYKIRNKYLKGVACFVLALLLILLLIGLVTGAFVSFLDNDALLGFFLLILTLPVSKKMTTWMNRASGYIGFVQTDLEQLEQKTLRKLDEYKRSTRTQSK